MSSYTAFMALYISTIIHAGLYYRKHMMLGFSSLFTPLKRRLRPRKYLHTDGSQEKPKGEIPVNKVYADVHYRLMQAYPEGVNEDSPKGSE